MNKARDVMPETRSSYRVVVSETAVTSAAAVELLLTLPPLPGWISSTLDRKMPLVLGRTLERDVRDSLSRLLVLAEAEVQAEAEGEARDGPCNGPEARAGSPQTPPPLEVGNET